MGTQLANWQNFYVIVGSASGALIGLQFVVIALISTRGGQVERTALRAFASPTVVFFSTVLALSALMEIPHQTRTSLGLILVVVALGGLAFTGWAAFHLHRADYQLDRPEQFWYAGLPALSFLAVLFAGVVMGSNRRIAFDMVGAATLALLLNGVHNAWDSAVWMVSNQDAGASTEQGDTK